MNGELLTNIAAGEASLAARRLETAGALSTRQPSTRAAALKHGLPAAERTRVAETPSSVKLACVCGVVSALATPDEGVRGVRRNIALAAYREGAVLGTGVCQSDCDESEKSEGGLHGDEICNVCDRCCRTWTCGPTPSSLIYAEATLISIADILFIDRMKPTT